MAELDPHIAAFLQAAAANPVPPSRELPLATVRENFRKATVRPDAGAPEMASIRDLTIAGAAGALPARLYAPQGSGETSAGLVFLHGGGFVIGDLDTHDGVCRRLAGGAGVRVLAVDYRLAPEHPFPASQDDAVEAVKWALAHAGEIGFDPARVAVGGDSAGAMLSAAACIRLRDEGGAMPAFQLLLYPGVMLDSPPPSMIDFGQGYFLTHDDMAFFNDALHPDPATMGHPYARLLEEAELAGLPPALVVTAGFDPLKDGGVWYADRLKAAGVEAVHIDFPTLTHAFYNFAWFSPGAAAAIDQTASALKAALAST